MWFDNSSQDVAQRLFFSKRKEEVETTFYSIMKEKWDDLALSSRTKEHLTIMNSCPRIPRDSFCQLQLNQPIMPQTKKKKRKTWSKKKRNPNQRWQSNANFFWEHIYKFTEIIVFLEINGTREGHRTVPKTIYCKPPKKKEHLSILTIGLHLPFSTKKRGGGVNGTLKKKRHSKNKQIKPDPQKKKTNTHRLQKNTN
jgi:hypothetical protein